MNVATFELPRIDAGEALTAKTYAALKRAISSMNVYATEAPVRLDDRQISEMLGVSRTPVREALVRLGQEGIVRTVPRKGTYIVRKTKREMVEVITVWAALEGMAARLITLHASDEEIARLRRMFATFEGKQVQAVIDEYSETNVRFHRTLLEMSRCKLLAEIAENLFIHMGWIRMRTIADGDRVSRSMIDHMQIITALETRQTDLAERLVRQHSLDLAKHVEQNVHYLG